MSERVEPPAEHRGVRWHWLVDSHGEATPREWFDGAWWFASRRVSPERLASWRRHYLAPCIPPEPCDV